MPRRHEALIPLTHDHHHTLAQARRLQDASKLEAETERRSIANDFVNFYLGRPPSLPRSRGAVPDG